MKHATALIHIAVCSTILQFAGQASGENVSSENVRSPWDEVPRSERMAWSDYPEAVRTAWDAVVTGVKESGRDAFPDLARFTDETDLGSRYLGAAFWMIDEKDGLDTFTPGDPHLLASTRGILPRLLDHNKRHETEALSRGLRYLAKKGDARDVPLFEKYLADPVFLRCQSEFSGDDRGEQFDLFYYLAFPYRILQHRAMGTNIVRGTFDEKLYPNVDPLVPAEGNSYSTNALRFIPSVANTGPQAAYVYAAMEQALHKVWAQNTVKRTEGATVERSGSQEGSPYGMLMGNAPELLTMRVWFDADGEAVCDVDLVKHGIFVPGLRVADSNTLPPSPQKPPLSPAAADTAGHAAILPPSQRLTIPLAFAAGVLAALGALAALRKTHRQ